MLNKENNNNQNRQQIPHKFQITSSTSDLYKTKTGPLEHDINDVSEFKKIKFEDNIINKLDFKSKPEHFPLHCFYLPGTWIVDEVDIDNEPCLFCVEGNSRYLYIGFYYEPSRFRTIKTEKRSKNLTAQDLNDLLEKFFSNNDYERTNLNKQVRMSKAIIWDQSQLHNSEDVYDFVENEWGVKTWMLNVKRTGHGQLRVLDRTVKTIRDLLENYKHKTYLHEPTTYVLKNYIIDYYNKSPHRTLEKMTNIKGMTPWNVHVNEVLEKQIIRYCQAWNYNMKMNPHYKINVGDKVLIKDIETRDFKEVNKKRTKYMNNNQVYTVNVIQDGHYLLYPPYPEQNKQLLLPRSMLVKIKVENED